MTDADNPKKDNKSLLKAIKAFNFSDAQVRVFFAKVRGVGEEVNASVIAVNSDPDLDQEIRRSLKAKVDRANHLETYDYQTADADEGFLKADAGDGQWTSLAKDISEDQTPGAKEAGDLKNSNVVIFELLFGDQPRLFAVKKLDEKVTPKRLKFNQFIFTKGKLNLLPDEAKVLNMSLGADFFVWDEQIFIANKKRFEEIMNIREGMIRKRDSLIEKLSKSPHFHGVEELKTAIGSNLHRLRRASKAHDADHFKKDGFINGLIALCEQHPHWKVEIQEGKIVITKDNVDDVLSLLNDQRAETLINKIIIDAMVSKPVASKE